MSLKLIVTNPYMERVHWGLNIKKPMSAPTILAGVEGKLFQAGMERALATTEIQNWWHLKKFKSETLSHVTDLSFRQLDEHLNKPSTLIETDKNLQFLARKLSDLGHQVAFDNHTFLSAFMITLHPDSVFEEKTEEAVRLQKLAVEMVRAFDELISKNDDGELLHFLEIYLSYVQCFNEWKEADKKNLASELIETYLHLEEQKIKAMKKPDPLSEEFALSFAKAQSLIENKIRLLGLNATEELERRRQSFQDNFETYQWKLLANQTIAHEIALHPQFRFTYNPDNPAIVRKVSNILKALSSPEINRNTLITALVEIREALLALSPLKPSFAELKWALSSLNLKSGFSEEEPLKYFNELYLFILSKMDELKPEGSLYRREISTLTMEDLPAALHLIYNRLDELQVDQSNLILDIRRSDIYSERAHIESIRFEERYNSYEASLVLTQKWLKITFKEHESRERLTNPLHLLQTAIVKWVCCREEALIETLYEDREALLKIRTELQYIVSTIVSKINPSQDYEESPVLKLIQKRVYFALTQFLYTGILPHDPSLQQFEGEIRKLGIELTVLTRFNFVVHQKRYEGISKEIKAEALLSYVAEKTKEVPSHLDWMITEKENIIALHNRFRKSVLIISALNFIAGHFERIKVTLPFSEIETLLNETDLKELFIDGSTNILPILTKIQELFRIILEKHSLTLTASCLEEFQKFLVGVIGHQKLQTIHHILLETMGHFAQSSSFKLTSNPLMQHFKNEILSLCQAFNDLVDKECRPQVNT